MVPTADATLLARCLQEIESRLGWGPAEAWSTGDFENLSEEMLQATGVSLSATTLKRVWGRVQYASQPQESTLNTLAQFAGYEHWRDFRLTHTRAELPPEPAPILTEKSVTTPPRRRGLLWGSVALLAVVVLGLLAWRRPEPAEPALEEAPITAAYDPAGVTFEAETVTLGLPNTVIFRYDYHGLPVQKAQLQQSWDESRRLDLDPTGHVITATYQLPGYYRAKLVADGQILREHDVYLTSNGWLATWGERDDIRYFLPEELAKKGALAVRPEAVPEPPEGSLRPMEFHYVDRWEGLSSAHFTLEASLRNTFRSGYSPCQYVAVMVLCTDGAFVVPLAQPGCVGDLSLMLNNQYVSGKTADLSALGVATDAWQRFRLEVADAQARIFLNDVPAATVDSIASAGQVVGLRFQFAVAGELDDVRLTDSEGLIRFEEHF
ncbi:hypothetical protein SAMN05421823_11337 [Catalinimonas alkaloidigena]|uniref:Uncharacterized protein n=1 Tax=Catalinimonas alkaloidigena TaxID=1075417 RepID=A0A1G9SZ07_9BACT|nr:hypothetical protein [Catalinimonas alkaloidigena]SDM40640.1 hypothetical protein SAMN05421823_11337 [Catalinimonas alkaloidigena]